MSKMAESRHTTGKMAVTSDNHEIRENMAREEVEQKFIANSIRPGIDVVPAKKKTFKITSVKLNDTNDGDSMDDLDESHTEMTEDYSSELLDTSRATDYEQETPSATEDIPLTNQTIRPVTDGKEKSDMHSRFRVVKIETKEPFHRGRWICLDYLDPLPPVNTEKSDTKVYEEVNSGSSSAGSSIHYIHGVDDPAKNPLLAGATGTVYFTSVLPPESTNNQETFQPIHPAPNTQPNMNSNPQSQLSSIGYFTDHSSQGQGSQLMCQTLNQSQSHQSISSLASTDIIQHTSGQPMIGDVHSGNPASQHAGSHTQNDSTNVGNIPKPNVYMPHFSGGQPLSMYPQNIQSTSMISSVVNSRPTSASSQDQSSNTYQTYVHLGQQIANTSVVQGNQSESIPSDVASEKKSNINASDVPSSNNDRTIVDETTGQIISSPFKDNLTGALDKDLNVIQNQNALSPALVAAVGDLQSPQEEEQG